jgi:hypothetical protein
MRTTIDLPDPLFREVKTRAVQQGVKLKDLVANYIEAGLQGRINESAIPPRRPRSAIPIAIQRVPGTPATPALSNAQIYTILNEEDLAEYHKLINP